MTAKFPLYGTNCTEQWIIRGEIGIADLPGHRKVLTAPHPIFRQKLPPKARQSKVCHFSTKCT